MRERLAVLGDPIGHSLSPAMHAAALQEAGISAEYEAHHVTRDDLPAHVDHLRREGYRGFNVTVPHKEAMLGLVDALAPSASHIGAVNTVVRDGDRLVGHSTDPDGFAAALDSAIERAGREPRTAVVFGAGGSARAVLSVLVSRGIRVGIANRTRDRAAAVARSVGGDVTILESHDLAESLPGIDLAVNTTSLGMPPNEDRSPLPDGIHLSPGTIVIDLVYGRETPLQRRAREAGCVTVDGLEMLVQQGAASFRLWFRVDPNIEAMRAACRDALMERST